MTRSAPAGRKTNSASLRTTRGAVRPGGPMPGIEPVGLAVHIGSQILRRRPIGRLRPRRGLGCANCGRRAAGSIVDCGGGLAIGYRDEPEARPGVGRCHPSDVGGLGRVADGEAWAVARRPGRGAADIGGAGEADRRAPLRSAGCRHERPAATGHVARTLGMAWCRFLLGDAVATRRAGRRGRAGL